MQERTTRYSLMQRMAAIALSVALVFGIMPVTSFAADSATSLKPGEIFTISDLETLTRPGDIYGENTLNAGKLTVGKSVSNAAVNLNYGSKNHTFTPAKNNFMVTISQAAQVMGLATQSKIPVDAVFVLDTSGSMGYNNGYLPTGRAEAMVEAANTAISNLLSANPLNRVAVVAFSSQGRGGGTSSDAAANLLTPLDSYTGDAATNHLRWASSGGTAYSADGNNNGGNNRPGGSGNNNSIRFGIGSSYNYIMGRNNAGTAGRRHGGNGGTNIQAGIALGAQQLLNAATTQAVVGGKTVTRMPVIIVLSDGQPTYVSSSDSWYNPSQTQQQGDGSDPYEGAGFMTMLTAAYYKGKVTEKYYNSTTGKNQCSFYTIGVELDELSGDAEALAQITMDPMTYTKGDYAAGNAASYYNYGNSWNAGNSKETTYGIKTYWDQYLAGAEFDVRTSSSGEYTITAQSITDTKSYVKDLAYNDDYFSADSIEELETAFSKLVSTIQLKAISSPTHVDVLTGADFSGYVTFTDPIGEYMEVKSMHGIVANGYLFQGAGFARRLKEGTDAEFNAMLKRVLETRMLISDSHIDVDTFLANALRSANQANYVNANNYDNSIVWWGNGFTPTGEEDEKVQVLGNADNDTIEYIEQMRAENKIPADADYVCRSYFFCGTADDAADNPDYEYLYFVVRVQRSLTAPYQQTVVISAPASLLSVETVLITENTTGSTPTYTATVQKAEPARVIYEVGLRSDLNAYNLESVLATDPNYLSQRAGGALTNYDPVTGTYNFYTNDWDRSKAADSHERAMAKATFDAAADNAFYTYQTDTLILNEDGTAYTGSSAPTGLYYYSRTYYDWKGVAASEDGTYTATEKTKLIEVRLPEDDQVIIPKDGKWYIAKGTYTASTLMVTGDDVEKEENLTETSEIVAHPSRTGEANNSHYTVYLGNNGKLSIRSVDTKTVDVTTEGGITIRNADGKIVTVGDKLTYKIQVINNDTVDVDAVVVDTIPAGTAYVPGSASPNADYNEKTGVLTWNLTGIKAGETVTVSFQVTVTEAALSGQDSVAAIENAGVVTLSNDFSYTTNKTSNPPVGKKVVDTQGKPIEDGVQAYDILVYRVRYYNDTASAAKITITDRIPTGTTYVEDSASHSGSYNAKEGMLTWTISNVQPGASGVVSFRVVVNGDAGETVENTASIKIGSNDPKQTNSTTVNVDQGSLVISKNVVVPAPTADYTQALGKSFPLHITEIGLDADGTYTLIKNGQIVSGGIRFTKGVATLTIQDGDVYEIQGLPAGAILSVTEAALPGFTPNYKKTAGDGSSSASAVEGRVTITANKQVRVDVENTYAPASVNFQLKGSKVLDTTVTVPDVHFGFTAIPCDSQGVASGSTSYLTGEVTVSSISKTAEIVFSPASFSSTGTYYYLIQEIIGGVTGVTYAQNQYLLAVEVYDDGSGVLKTSASLKQRAGDSGSFSEAVAYTDTGVTFTNKYEPLATQLVLTGLKTLAGRNLKADEFSFEVRDAQGNLVTSSTNAANGQISFRPITYIAADLNGGTEATFTYKITELNNGIQGVVYDTTEYTVTVTLKNVNGKLAATAAYPDGGVVFRNSYTPEKTSVTLEATKVLENIHGADRVLQAGDFNFVVKQGNTQVATGTNDATGKVKFSAIAYTLQDLNVVDDQYVSTEFTYIVSEVIPVVNKDPSVQYDESTYEVKVTLNYDPATGKLSTQVSYPNGGVVFTNTQEPSTPLEGTAVTIQAKKNTSLAYNRPLKANEFLFQMVDKTTGNVVATATNDATGNIAFSYSYPATAPVGDYVYIIREWNDGKGGITYDAAEFEVTVRVSFDGSSSGALVAEVIYPDQDDNGEPDAIVFTNSYNPAPTTFTPEAEKILLNRVMVDNEFVFEVKMLNSDDVVSTGWSKADGTVVFSSMGFTQAGDFIYRVVETAGKLTNVTYTDVVYYLHVHVEDDLEGTLTATGKYYTAYDAATKVLSGEVEHPVFTNVYKPAGITVQLSASKVLTGRDMIKGEFSFVVLDDNGNVKATGGNAAAKDGVSSTVLFSDIGYSSEDIGKTYTYTILELNTKQGGVDFDETVYYVTVKIENDAQAGVLKATVTYYQDAQLQVPITDLSQVKFENSYSYTPISIPVHADKILVNKKLEDQEFTFYLKDKDGKTLQTIQNDADGHIHFANIPITAPGTFFYTVEEKNGGGSNYTYDGSIYTIKVVVTGADGVLTPVVTYYKDNENTTVEGIEFVNTYKPSPVKQDLSAAIDADKVVKTPTGITYSPAGFKFKVVDIAGKTIQGLDDNNQLVDMIGESDGNGNITFPKFVFDKAGEYHYWVSEMPSSKPGVQDDTTMWEIHILVRYDNNEGKLYIKAEDVKTYKVSRDTVDTTKIQFVNTYTPNSVTVTLLAKKKLEGRPLQNHEFVFHLMEGDIIRAEARNDANGNIVFQMNYTEIGTHTYTIREHNNGLGGVAYDEMSYDTVTVTISDNGSGQLIATIGEKNVGGQQVDTKVTFKNFYTTTAATAEVKAGKILTGGKALKEGMFTFELRDKDGNLAATAVNDADGNVVFYVNNLTETGTFEYIMKETQDQNPDSHIGYDESEHTVYITVTDNLKGALVAEVEYDNDENTPPIFVNSYTPDEYQLKITGTKRLVGRRLRNNEFVFEVRNSLGEVVATAKNAANGSITFPAIKLDSAGEYEFTVHEVEGNLNDVTYDGTVHTVKVTIVNEDGVLSGEVEYSVDGVVFVNVYESTVPKTGDDGMFLLYLSMLCVSCGAVISLSMLRRKNENAC